MCAVKTVLFAHGHRVKSQMMGVKHSSDTQCVFRCNYGEIITAVHSNILISMKDKALGPAYFSTGAEGTALMGAALDASMSFWLVQRHAGCGP